MKLVTTQIILFAIMVASASLAQAYVDKDILKCAGEMNSAFALKHERTQRPKEIKLSLVGRISIPDEGDRNRIKDYEISLEEVVNASNLHLLTSEVIETPSFRYRVTGFDKTNFKPSFGGEIPGILVEILIHPGQVKGLKYGLLVNLTMTEFTESEVPAMASIHYVSKSRVSPRISRYRPIKMTCAREGRPDWL
jgi:hypothetical protein